MSKRILMFVVFLFVFISLGCSPITIGGGPRARLGCYATSTPGTRFIGLKGLGQHNYTSFIGEGNGVAYTCNGGHIDITHLRISADNTYNVTKKIQESLLKGKPWFKFSLQVDKSTNYITWEYPAIWNSLSVLEKQDIALQISHQLAPYLVFTATTWHEMLTWYGFKCLGFIPEDASGFSWEDSYSNLLGCYLAVEALENSKLSYNKAMTLALRNEMEELGIQKGSIAKKASAKMRGKWFTGNFWVVMKKRNFDVGLDDGYVSNPLVPDLDCCPNAKLKLLPAPDPDVSEHGFSYKYEIKPKEWEKGKLLRIVYPEGKGKVVEPLKHFPVILAHLEQEAIAKGYEIR